MKGRWPHECGPLLIFKLRLGLEIQSAGSTAAHPTNQTHTHPIYEMNKHFNSQTMTLRNMNRGITTNNTKRRRNNMGDMHLIHYQCLTGSQICVRTGCHSGEQRRTSKTIQHDRSTMTTICCVTTER